MSSLIITVAEADVMVSTVDITAAIRRARMSIFPELRNMAQQYVGGPKSGVAPTTRQISSGGDIYAQGVDVYAQGVRTKKSHAYRGGRKTVVPQADLRR